MPSPSEDSIPNHESAAGLPGETGLSSAAFLLKTLADENRLRILLSLSAGRKTVSAIVEGMGLSQPLVSHHLKELRRALLVNVERKGLFVYYEMADKRVIEIVRSAATLAADLLSQRKTF
jgi:ArsR family transcriptional regulator, zinc-responsive transcriptional repressor